jgi:hypothetical protein
MDTFEPISRHLLWKEWTAMLDSIGWPLEKFREHISETRPYYFAKTDVPFSADTESLDVRTSDYATVMRTVAIVQYILRNSPFPLRGLHERWVKLYSRLETLYTLRSPGIESCFDGTVVRMLAAANEDPVRPSIAMHTLYASFVQSEDTRLKTIFRVFGHSMEAVYKQDLHRDVIEDLT